MLCIGVICIFVSLTRKPQARIYFPAKPITATEEFLCFMPLVDISADIVIHKLNRVSCESPESVEGLKDCVIIILQHCVCVCLDGERELAGPEPVSRGRITLIVPAAHTLWWHIYCSFLCHAAQQPMLLTSLHHNNIVLRRNGIHVSILLFALLMASSRSCNSFP